MNQRICDLKTTRLLSTIHPTQGLRSSSVSWIEDESRGGLHFDTIEAFEAAASVEQPHRTLGPKCFEKAEKVETAHTSERELF